MTVIETTLATKWSAPPGPQMGANPDFEDAYYKVVRWWVEIDPAGVPQREVGFNAAGEAVVAGPFGRNMGFWTDSHMVFEVKDHKVVPLDEFESAWALFESCHATEAGDGG